MPDWTNEIRSNIIQCSGIEIFIRYLNVDTETISSLYIVGGEPLACELLDYLLNILFEILPAIYLLIKYF